MLIMKTAKINEVYSQNFTMALMQSNRIDSIAPQTTGTEKYSNHPSIKEKRVSFHFFHDGNWLCGNNLIN